MNGVSVGEDVMGGFPVGMFVGGTKTRHPERRRIGERAAEVGGTGTGTSGGFERINDRDRIVSEKPLGEQDVIRPAVCRTVLCEKAGQFQSRFLA